MTSSVAIRSAALVLPSPDLDADLAFFERLGFRVDAIAPADAPRRVTLSGHGVRLRLDRDAPGLPGALQLECDDPDVLADGARELTSPGGARIAVVAARPALVVPPPCPSFVLARHGDEHWGVGRAGMRYRDLIPDRQGGRFIGSAIALPDGGPVPDYVHFHEVRFQLIYCRRGWVRVVYEDQGPPFVLQAGDCVLQPPRIRHRVLESSAGLEVVELTCPAEHETFADHALALPTGTLHPERDFGGQRFVRHEAGRATWGPWRAEGLVCRDTGIGAATSGLAGVRVVRPAGAARTPVSAHAGELMFWFVLAGTAALERGDTRSALAEGDALVIPAGMPHALAELSPDLELLEVTFPAQLDSA